MAIGDEAAEQSDTRFGRKGIAAWIYFLWPFGPLPGALISAWAILHFSQEGDSFGAIVVFLFVFIFCVWLCSVGLLITKEALSTVQRIEIIHDKVFVYPYLGQRIVLDRSEKASILPYHISSTRKTLTLSSGLLSAERTNWLVRFGPGRVLVMNGEFFDPSSIFLASTNPRKE